MGEFLGIAGENFISPIVLSFLLGLGAALVRSDLSFPEAIAKGLSLYLLFAIGFKGGVSVSTHSVDAQLGAALVSGVVLSLFIPLIAFVLFRLLTKVPVIDAAAVAGHYGSISIVTFVAASSLLEGRGIFAEGYLVAVAAIMEAPAIITALWLAFRGRGKAESVSVEVWREIFFNGSIVLLLGAFLIGWITGPDGLDEIESFIVTPFKGVLCLFLLDMGLVAGHGLRSGRGIVSPGAIVFGVLMPLIGAAAGLSTALLLGLSLGGTVLLMVLCASASYIAVPAAMRVALPEANPARGLSLSIGITFPFNVVLGIPLYLVIATAVLGH